MKSKAIKLHKLTEDERKFAEDNHKLIYSFIHKHGYSVDEHYGIVTYGYLLAVHVYNSREDLQQQYPFVVIAKRCMGREMGNYSRMLNCQKRVPTTQMISLDAEYADSVNLHGVIGSSYFENEYMENDTVENILLRLPELQRKIVRLLNDGYSAREISSLLDMKQSTYYNEVKHIKNKLRVMVG